jgi:hypothetical protein
MSYAKVFGFVPINQGDTIKTYVLNVTDGSASLSKIDLNELAIYPNPAHTNLSVISREIPRLLSINGTEQRLTWSQEGRLFKTNVSELPSGMYLILADGKSRRFVKP